MPWKQRKVIEPNLGRQVIFQDKVIYDLLLEKNVLALVESKRKVGKGWKLLYTECVGSRGVMYIMAEIV